VELTEADRQVLTAWMETLPAETAADELATE
jgi:hypothetical protein